MVTVFGLGFVGLTTALGFAEMGYKVYGIDIDENRMDTIKSGKLPFLEPGLDEALERHLKNRNFIPTNEVKKAVKESEYIFLCVGTPCMGSGEADLTYLYKAIDSALDGNSDNIYRVIITKSTIPPSTTMSKIIPYIESKGFKIGDDIGIAHNPEFLREGYCWSDFINADRIVIGICDDKSKNMLGNLYSKVSCKIHYVNLNTSEYIKYLSNTLLATLISYSNEMSIIANKIGNIDVARSFKILGEDKRWNNCEMKNYVYPGCGYGGYCLPKDTNALYSLVKNMGVDAPILKNVIETNNNMADVIFERIIKDIDQNCKIGIMGLAFKPLSNDVRDTPSRKVIKKLIENDYKNIIAYDPIAVNEFKKAYTDIDMEFTEDINEILSKADIFVILTAWKEFSKLNKLTDKPIIDCRYMMENET